MTKPLVTGEIAAQVTENLPGSVVESNEFCIYVKPEMTLKVAQFLNASPDIKLNYLNCITGVDYLDHLEVVYHLTSIEFNHSLVLKTRCDRVNSEVASLYSLFRGADYQEREIYDLLGVKFVGHPNLRRLFMWDGFEGHPLRRDYL